MNVKELGKPWVFPVSRQQISYPFYSNFFDLKKFQFLKKTGTPVLHKMQNVKRSKLNYMVFFSSYKNIKTIIIIMVLSSKFYTDN